jgi:hypothetical protein
MATLEPLADDCLLSPYRDRLRGGYDPFFSNYQMVQRPCENGQQNKSYLNRACQLEGETGPQQSEAMRRTKILCRDSRPRK